MSLCAKFWIVLLISPASGNQAADDSARFLRLLAWIDNGTKEAGLEADHPPMSETLELRRGPFGLSLFAKKRLEEKDLLAIIPASRLVGTHLLAPDEADLSIDDGLSLFLARQKLLGANSTWAPYIDLLPADYSLPKYWDPAFVKTHMNGSDFPKHVHAQAQLLEMNLKRISELHNIPLRLLIWGYDAMLTRSMAAEGLTKVMFPVFDLALHGDSSNIKCEYQADRQILKVTVRRRIRVGDPILNGYLAYNSTNESEKTSNWDALKSWGFASQRVSINPGSRCSSAYLSAKGAQKLQKRIQKHKSVPAPAVGEYTVNICDTAEENKHRTFLSFLRLLASDSASLPTYNGQYVPASNWGVEANALRMGQTWLTKRLQRYPETLEQDDVLLADQASFTDSRVYFMVMLRRDEKFALSWWLALFRRELAAGSGRTDNDLVDESYLLEQPTKYSKFHEACITFFKILAHDATEAADQPLEFGLVMGTIAVSMHIVTFAVFWCCGGQASLWRPGWLFALAALVVNAVTCRWDMVWFTLDHQMNLASISALALWFTTFICNLFFWKAGLKERGGGRLLKDKRL